MRPSSALSETKVELLAIDAHIEALIELCRKKHKHAKKANERDPHWQGRDIGIPPWAWNSLQNFQQIAPSNTNGQAPSSAGAPGTQGGGGP